MLKKQKSSLFFRPPDNKKFVTRLWKRRFLEERKKAIKSGPSLQKSLKPLNTISLFETHIYVAAERFSTQCDIIREWLRFFGIE